MKVKLYVVTYNRPDDLKTTVEDILTSDVMGCDELELYIVNNHSQIELSSGADRFTVLNNTFRPDFSTGHLSRNYNEIFLHGIKDLREPDCDILIHSHDDNTFSKDWFSQLVEFHKKYSFITFSQGCGVCSYKPEAIRRIGMWDERFCTIGYHEGDYFLRALRCNRDETSINDPQQRREWNPLPHIIKKKPDTGQNANHQASFNNYSVCRRIWELKYPGLRDGDWTQEVYMNAPKPKLPTFMMYPYFEKYIYDLDDKYFPTVDAFGQPFLPR